MQQLPHNKAQNKSDYNTSTNKGKKKGQQLSHRASLCFLITTEPRSSFAKITIISSGISFNMIGSSSRVVYSIKIWQCDKIIFVEGTAVMNKEKEVNCNLEIEEIV